MNRSIVAAGMVDLAKFSAGETSSTATGASADGSVVVGTMTIDGNVRSFRSLATGKADLGPPPAGYTSPEATGVSADGSTVVGLVRVESGPGTQGFVWTETTGMQVFTLPSFSTLELRAVSADGLVYMGNGTRPSGCRTTFIWSQALGSAGPVCSIMNPNEYFVGEGLSGDGLAIVGTWTPFRNSGFIWRAGTGVQVVMGTFGNHFAYGTNHDGGVVVGVTAPSPVASVAGIWTQASGLQLASSYLQSLGVNYPPGYEFQGAAVRLVSAAGDALVIESVNAPAGFSYVGPCYANCDGSRGTPRLTGNDFMCFINKYASGDSGANCDGSTVSPVLTPADFVCFVGAYSAGCS